MADVANSFFLQEVFKDAEKIQSFVIEELALRQLLESAWRHVGRKLLKHLNGVVDFRKNTFSLPKSLNLAMWLTEDMYDVTLEKVWEKIAPTVKKYVSKAYQRGIDEEGNPPLHTAKKTVTKSVSSVYAERKAQAIDILVNMARMSFTGYARESAIPAIKQAINGLGRLETLRKNLPDTQLDIDRQVAEIGRTEMLRKLRVAALDNARIKLINSLRKQVGEYPLAGTMANLTVSRAHHFGFLDWADSNGIMYYEVSAVLDDKTCPACFKMDGKVFSVKDALAYRDKFLAAAGDKNRLKEETPFLTSNDAIATGSIDISSSLDRRAEFDSAQYNALSGDTIFGLYREQREYLNKNFARWSESITKEQYWALDYYKGVGYADINNYLRGERKIEAIANDTKRAMPTLEETFKNARIENNTVVYRGQYKLYGDAEEKLSGKKRKDIIGTEFILDKGYSSTSLSRGTAEEFTGVADEDCQSVLYKIYIPKTSKAAISPDVLDDITNSEEMEVLVNKNSRVRVVGYSTEKKGVTEIRVFELLLLD